MIHIIRLTTLIFVLVFSASLSAESSHPSSGAVGMAGAEGTIEFKPVDHVGDETTWWKDTDGIAPDVAGCHVGTDEHGDPNGRMFGEACLSDVLLVESNPGKDELHSHKHDTGHPDTFNCSTWCQSHGSATGMCVAASAPPCESSAVCECVD